MIIYHVISTNLYKNFFSFRNFKKENKHSLLKPFIQHMESSDSLLNHSL